MKFRIEACHILKIHMETLKIENENIEKTDFAKAFSCFEGTHMIALSASMHTNSVEMSHTAIVSVFVVFD